MFRAQLALGLALTCALALPAAASAGPGDLDPLWGDGRLTSVMLRDTGEPQSVVLGDGRALVATERGVLGLTARGARDRRFGRRGRAFDVAFTGGVFGAVPFGSRGVLTGRYGFSHGLRLRALSATGRVVRDLRFTGRDLPPRLAAHPDGGAWLLRPEAGTYRAVRISADGRVDPATGSAPLALADGRLVREVHAVAPAGDRLLVAALVDGAAHVLLQLDRLGAPDPAFAPAALPEPPRALAGPYGEAHATAIFQPPPFGSAVVVRALRVDRSGAVLDGGLRSLYRGRGLVTHAIATAHGIVVARRQSTGDLAERPDLLRFTGAGRIDRTFGRVRLPGRSDASRVSDLDVAPDGTLHVTGVPIRLEDYRIDIGEFPLGALAWRVENVPQIPTIRSRALARASRPALRIACSSTCRGSVTLEHRGGPAGRARVRIAADATRTVRVPLAARARRAGQRVTALVRVHGPGGVLSTDRATFRLR